MANELTDLPGVGNKTAENLRRAGFDSPDKIANASVRRLSRVSGIGSKSARKIIKAAGGSTVGVDVRKQRERKYGETFETIKNTPASEIESSILSSENTDFTKGSITARKKEGMEYQSPFTVKASGPRKRSLEKIHQNRSERAQDVDEQQNAPITTDEEKWIENKNRYDYPGVDTIPESRMAARAESAAKVAQEQGALDKVEQKGNARSGLQGKFSPQGRDTYGKEANAVRVQENASEPSKTLAHEVGHAFDFGFGESRGFNLGGQLLGLEDESVDEETERELFEEAKNLSKKARGGFGSKRQYRTRFEELTADVVGQAIVQPRATKRDAPKLFERMQEVDEDGTLSEAIPDPLGDKSERQGFLDL